MSSAMVFWMLMIVWAVLIGTEWKTGTLRTKGALIAPWLAVALMGWRVFGALLQ